MRHIEAIHCVRLLLRHEVILDLCIVVYPLRLQYFVLLRTTSCCVFCMFYVCLCVFVCCIVFVTVVYYVNEVLS